MLSVLLFLVLVIIGYLCGSVCSAIIVSQMFSLPDPRVNGSQNPGATNVLRLAGKKYAAIVLLGDVFKGLLPVLLGKLLGAGPATLGFICLAAVVGHMYPAFFGFKGGKGVATALGALLGLHFIMGVVIIAIWLLIANFTRYASLASIVAIILAPLLAIVSLGNMDTFPPLLLITILVLYQHRNNITRLIDGEEPKIQHHQFSDVVTEEILQDAPSTAAEAPPFINTEETEVPVVILAEGTETPPEAPKPAPEVAVKADINPETTTNPEPKLEK